MVTKEEIEARIAESTRKYKFRQAMIATERANKAKVNKTLSDTGVVVRVFKLLSGGSIVVAVRRQNWPLCQKVEDGYEQKVLYHCTAAFQSPKDKFNINVAKQLILDRLDLNNPMCYELQLTKADDEKAMVLYRIKLTTDIILHAKYIPKWLRDNSKTLYRATEGPGMMVEK